MKSKYILFIALMFALIYYSVYVVSAPIGATLTPGISERKPGVNATNITAQAGNVTFLTVDLSQTSGIWQGYYGEVTGGILLEDASGNTFYDWNVVDAVGEVYATRRVVTDWSILNCSNQTDIYMEEERLTIQNSSSEGINDTFTLTLSHPDFVANNKVISGCRCTRTYNETEGKFWNVILNTDENTTIYTSLMDNNEIGFDGTTVDFQLLVPVNLSESISIYNIYVELG